MMILYNATTQTPSGQWESRNNIHFLCIPPIYFLPILSYARLTAPPSRTCQEGRGQWACAPRIHTPTNLLISCGASYWPPGCRVSPVCRASTVLPASNWQLAAPRMTLVGADGAASQKTAAKMSEPGRHEHSTAHSQQGSATARSKSGIHPPWVIPPSLHHFYGR